MNKGNSIPKKHHYVPVSYLANFTKDGTDRSQLWVFDHTNGNQWPSRPKNIAYENDFHTVETIEGKDMKSYEEAFSQVEGMGKQIITNIISSLKMPMPDTEEYNWLMNFIALLCERTRARRNHFSESMAEVLKMAARVGFHHKEYFDRHKEKIEKEVGGSVNLSHEELKQFIESDEYTINFHNNFHMESFMNRVDAILEPLAHRKWSICISDPKHGDFVCSDNPVCLRNVQIKESFFNSPGHGVLNTEVSIPLSPRILLLGRFEAVHPPVGMAPDRKFVAQMNSWTSMYAERYVFSKKEDFLWWNNQGKICGIDDLKLMHSKKMK